MTRHTFRVIDFGSDQAVSAEDGEALHAEIRRALAAGDNVALDFEGVTALTSLFLNASVGQLLAEYSTDELTERVKILSDDQEVLRLIRRVVERAKEYFANPQEQAARAAQLAEA